MGDGIAVRDNEVSSRNWLRFAGILVSCDWYKPNFMKSILFVLIMGMCTLFARAEKLTGKIISEGKSKEVTFDLEVPLSDYDLEWMQYKVKYFDENGQRKSLKPTEAEEIQFEHEGRPVRMISCVNPGLGLKFFKGKKIFLFLEVDGPLRLYRFYYTTGENNVGPTPKEIVTQYKHVYQKLQYRVVEPAGITWKPDMMKYFAECQEVVDKIDQKEFRKEDAIAVAELYNEKCGSELY
jgi:hypothetical protein